MTTPSTDTFLNRRTVLKLCGAASLGCLLDPWESLAAGHAKARRFHLCLSPDALERDPQLLPTVLEAGVDTVWLGGFFYGHWPNTIEKLGATRRQLERAGLAVHMINLPLGHPGDSLGATDGNFPLTPPRHWRLASKLDGGAYAGTSLHEPATTENVAALRSLWRAGFKRFFVDDDFRLARGPGVIGGCFCPEHRDRFLKHGGFAPARWDELLDDVRQRRLSRLLCAWVEFTCDELMASFRAQARAAGNGRLGIMVMYLGAEKAGIRLKDYADVPFRVGELMFDDRSFGPVKGKTDELFSALMHRRFARPELAYSETTAFPADKLSARNMAAKLVVSTLADVRHSMFMSGVTPFPRSHWETLAPAMKTQAALHAQLAGHKPRGPFKHFWGERSRWVGDDRPFSLFLAAGVPFEVADKPPGDGWTFLSDFDARAVADGELASAGTKFIHRPLERVRLPTVEVLDESLESLFTFKARMAPELERVPHVLENEPVVCAWYPTARAVLLWNLSEQAKPLTVKHRTVRREVTVPPLGTSLLEDIG
jgi:hypothetical protein